MKKQDDSPCSVFFMLGFLGFIAFLIYKMVRFFMSPAGLHGLLELLKGLGLCLGFVVLIFLVMGIYFRLAPSPQKAKLSKMSKDYAVRCDRIEIETQAGVDTPDGLADSRESNISTPIYLFLSTTNYGLLISPIAAETTWECIPIDNDERYRILSMDHPAAIILPTGYIHLYYILYHREDNLTFTEMPIDQPGFYGVLPIDLGRKLVEIVITNTHILDVADLQNYIPRQLALRIRLVALDQSGDEDGLLTRELYETLYNYLNPPDTSYEDYYGY